MWSIKDPIKYLQQMVKKNEDAPTSANRPVFSVFSHVSRKMQDDKDNTRQV